MKFLDYLFHGKELKAIGNYFKMLNGYSPTFTSFSGGVYEMDLTRTAINNFATHCSKLKPEIEGSALKSLEKTLQHKPNYFMDTTKFIKRLATYVAVEHTAFIIPIEDEYGRLCGWYPLRAERCEVVESEGQLYLRYLFANGSYGAIVDLKETNPEGWENDKRPELKSPADFVGRKYYASLLPPHTLLKGFGLLDGFLNGAHHVEGLLWQIVVRAFNDTLEAADRVFDRHSYAGNT